MGLEIQEKQFRVLFLHLSFYLAPFVPYILVSYLHYFLIPQMIHFHT